MRMPFRIKLHPSFNPRTGSGKLYEDCCGPFHRGAVEPTAEDVVSACHSLVSHSSPEGRLAASPDNATRIPRSPGRCRHACERGTPHSASAFSPRSLSGRRRPCRRSLGARFSAYVKLEGEYIVNSTSRTSPDARRAEKEEDHIPQLRKARLAVPDADAACPPD